jgi:crossover junction endodeoxyribonuclease RusA
VKELHLTLPLPPSVNHERYGNHRRTPAARGWRSAAWALAVDQKNRAGWATVPRGQLCRLTLAWHLPDRRRRDVDNLLKPLKDLLTAAHVWEDDQHVVVWKERYDVTPKSGTVDVVVVTDR